MSAKKDEAAAKGGEAKKPGKAKKLIVLGLAATVLVGVGGIHHDTVADDAHDRVRHASNASTEVLDGVNPNTDFRRALSRTRRCLRKIVCSGP